MSSSVDWWLLTDLPNQSISSPSALQKGTDPTTKTQQPPIHTTGHNNLAKLRITLESGRLPGQMGSRAWKKE
jgi:hypothetical protein